MLHLLNGLYPSGMERMLVSAAPYFQSLGVDSVVVGQGDEHPFRENLEDAGYVVESIPELWTLAGIRAYRRLVTSTWRPDVVHVHSERAYAPAVIGAGRRPVVRTIHSLFRPTGPKRILRNVLANVADSRVSTIVACSSEVAENEEQFGRSSQVIWNWVDDRFYEVVKSARDVKPTILIVGNCSPIKRHWLAIEAAVSLGYLIIHMGAENGLCSRERQALAEAERRNLLLHRGSGDPAVWMMRDPVFVAPSEREGMGVALAEALVAGLRAVVSDSQGLQWSRDFPGVSMVQDSESWVDALSVDGQTGSESSVRVPANTSRFRAELGAARYLEVYQRALASSRYRGAGE